MNIADIIAPERVSLVSRVYSKKRALQRLAELLATGAPYLTASEIFTALVAREKLGSTGIGCGVAIPHARMAGTDECIGAFVRLPQAMEFDADDGQRVDLMFGVLIPEQATQTHLALLHSLADMFKQPTCLSTLRQATQAQALFTYLTQYRPLTPARCG